MRVGYIVALHQLLAYDLENIAVGTAMAQGFARLFGLGIFAGLADQGAQLLAVGAGARS